MKNGRFTGAIVGCGAVANHTHLPSWKSAKGAEIVAACDPNRDAVVRTAEHWGIPKTFTDFQAMLDGVKPDFVDICTPPMNHCELVVQAMQAGAHVVVEKPMAHRVEQALEMVSTARKNNIKLCVIHSLLFSPVIRQAKRLVEQGVIGDVLNIDIRHFSRNKRHLGEKDHWCHDSSLPGGLLHEITPHPSYLSMAFVGDVTLVNAIAKKKSDVEWVNADELVVLLNGERGMASFNTSYNSPRDSIIINIFGTKGFIFIDHMAQVLIRRWPRSINIKGFLMDRVDLVLPVLTSAVFNGAYRFVGKVRNRSGHEKIIHTFIESMQNDTEPPVNGEEGLKVVRLLDDIWRHLGVSNEAQGK
jgi:predicted dehydrogenase